MKRQEHMIRPILTDDAPAIAAIYADYVAQTTISFETVPPTPEQMRERLAQFDAHGNPARPMLTLGKQPFTSIHQLKVKVLVTH